MTAEGTTVLVTDPDLARERQAQIMALTQAERRWLANQEKKMRGTRSKYVPHQGARERARRLRQRGA